MTMETYRLEVRETDDPGIDADLYDADETIAESTYISYDNYDLEPPTSRDEQPSYAEEITADVTTIDLQIERVGGGFSVRVLGDRDEIASIRINDEEWELN